MRGKAGHATGDIFLGVLIVGVWVLADLWLLGAPERDKRDVARTIVRAIAEANAKRRSDGRQAVTGPIDAAAAGRDLPGDGYDFFGADDAWSPCVTARAARTVSDGARWPYSIWGVCVDRFGNFQDYWGNCSLKCEEKAAAPLAAPSEPARVSVSRSAAAPPASFETPRERPGVHQGAAAASGRGSKPERAAAASARERPSRFSQPMVPVLPSVNSGSEESTSAKGCSTAGCGDGECCESASDRCVSCPGGSCCDQQQSGCGGTCEKDDDCPQGCACSIPDGRSWGSCGANSSLTH